MTHIFLTHEIPGKALETLRRNKQITLHIHKGESPISRKELLKQLKGKNILISTLTQRVDAELFDAAPTLKMVANYAVGFDNVDVAEAKKRGIAISNAPAPETSESVAEHTIALLFALTHRIVEGDAFARAGKYHTWSPTFMLGTDLLHKTIGIIGTGRIGSTVVQRLHDGFGANIVYTDTKRNPQLEAQTGARYLSKMALLKKADVVSLHVPLLPSTHHLISTKEFNVMKKTAFLINTARGPVVDEKALLNALVNKQIAGAGLDVFECEPLIDCNPKDNLALRKMPNVVMTPHTASATREAREAMTRVTTENILAFLDGIIPPNIVKYV